VRWHRLTFRGLVSSYCVYEQHPATGGLSDI